MTGDQEQLFINYWEANRERQGRISTQLFSGLAVGLLFAVPVLVILISAKLWYKRADMAANSMMSPAVLIFAVVIIAAFVAIFYKRHQWDMKEQQYLEFKARQKQREDERTVQQPGL